MEDVNVCTKFLWVIWGELLKLENMVQYVSAQDNITRWAD